MCENTARGHLRMQMPDARGIRLANHIQVHEMAVIRQKIVDLAWDRPGGIGKGQNQSVMRSHARIHDARRHLKRPVEVSREVAGFRAPPAVAAPENQDYQSRGRPHQNTRAAFRPCR